MEEERHRLGERLPQDEVNNEIPSFLSRVRDEYRAADWPVDTTKIGFSWFQERGLLRQLLFRFNGDPTFVFRAIFEKQQHFPASKGGVEPLTDKPLLNSGDTRGNRDLKRMFHQRANEIATAVDVSHGYMNTGRSRFIASKEVAMRLYGSGGKSGRRQREVFRGRKRESQHYNWLQESIFQDIRTIVEGCIEPGNNVCCLASNVIDPLLTTVVLDKKGREGKLFVSASRRDTAEILFEKFQDLLLDMEWIKGFIHSKPTSFTKYRRDPLVGKNYISEQFRRYVGSIFSYRLRDEEWYLQSFSSNNKRLRDEFYLFWDIIPSSLDQIEMLSALEEKSLSAVVTDRAIRQIPEAKRLSLIWAADRVLQVGGYLIFYEGAYEQAAIEYYGAELFQQKYRRVMPEQVNHPASWAIFQKLHDEFSVEAIPPNMPQFLFSTPQVSEDIAIYEKEVQNKHPIQTFVYSAPTERPESMLPLGGKDHYSVTEIARAAKVTESKVQERIDELDIKASIPGKKRQRGKRRTKPLFNQEEAQIISSGLRVKGRNDKPSRKS